MAIDASVMDGPIPGENFTSDTKNYPWHRPPEFTDLDKAIEVSFKRLTEENASVGIITMLEMGMTVADLTSAFVLSGVGAGKWTPDFAILLAGPVAHIIYLMAKGYGIDCDLGIDDKYRGPTKAFFKAAKVDRELAEAAGQEINLDVIKGAAADQSNQPKGGFMGMNEQLKTDTATSDEAADYDQPQMGANV